MRIILYLGKGGVGKTTTAAASAVRCAELGYRTLVVSTDIAHSLADSLDTPLTGEPREIAPNLFAQEINVVEEVRKHWGEMQEYVGNLLRKQGMSKAIAEEMAIIPGMEEVISLLHINQQAEEGHFDRVIVDAAPTGETIRLLTVPESFQWYMSRFTGWGGDPTMKIAGALIKRFLPDKDVMGGLNNLVAGVKKLQGVLTDPKITSYRVVLNPEKMVIKEGARAVSYLSLFNYPVDGVVVNRILPGVETVAGEGMVTAPSSDPYLQRLQETQARYLAEIEREFYPLPILRAGWYDQEMVGIDRLRELGNSLFGPLGGDSAEEPATEVTATERTATERTATEKTSIDPGDIFFVGQTQQIIEEGQDFVLKLPLPNVEVEKVRLKKRGDELFVSIGNFKRELLLPTVLAQRSASSANFQNGMLVIRFPPTTVPLATDN